MSPTELQLDTLRELINIGIGRAASILSTMTSETVELTVPEISVLPLTDVHRALDSNSELAIADVRQAFHGGLLGSADLLFPRDSAAALVNAVTGEVEDDLDLDELRVETLSEIGNIVINGVMGSLMNILDTTVEYDVPVYREQSLHLLFPPGEDGESRECILVNARFTVQSIEITGDILLIFDVTSHSSLWASIDRLVSKAT